MKAIAFLTASFFVFASHHVMAQAPTVTLTAVTNVLKGTATLNGTITGHGTAGTVKFLYNKKDDAAVVTVTPADAAFTANEVNKAFSVNIPVPNPPILDQSAIYEIKFVATAGGADTSDSSAFVPNNLPKARADEHVQTSSAPANILVLANDKDLDEDVLTIKSVTAGKDGTATIEPGRKFLIYTPAKFAKGTDTFTYTVDDGFGGTATATVTIKASRLGFRGMQSLVLKDSEGNIIGMIRVYSSGDGTFSGKVTIFGNNFPIRGTLDAQGRFHGVLPNDGNPIDITFDMGKSDAGAPTFTANVTRGGVAWEGTTNLASLKPDRREEIAGKYTMKIPSSGGGSTTDASGNTVESALPEGTGFARVEVKPWGDVRITGKLGDGRKFTTGGILMGDGDNATVSVYAAPKSSRVNGTLTFGTGEQPTISGTWDWFQPPRGDAHYFPDGFYTTVSPSGGKYTPPGKGDRALDGTSDAKEMSITISKGDLTSSITHNLQIDSRDHVRVLDPGADLLEVKINRKKGIFTAEFQNEEGDNRKAQGALLQADQSGHGVFNGKKQTGTVVLSVGHTNTPGVTPTPPITFPGTITN